VVPDGEWTCASEKRGSRVEILSSEARRSGRSVFGGIHLQGDGEIAGAHLRCIGQRQSPSVPGAGRELERKGLLTYAREIDG
jgi:hypothetical protein